MNFETYNPEVVAAGQVAARAELDRARAAARDRPTIMIIPLGVGWPTAGHFILNRAALGALAVTYAAADPIGAVTHVELSYATDTGHIGIRRSYHPYRPTALPVAPNAITEPGGATLGLDNRTDWPVQVDASGFLTHHQFDMNLRDTFRRCPADLTAGPLLVFHPTRTI